MAGLLDIFGTGGTDTLGLLGMSADDIQRQRDDAQAQALYALAANLFKGGPTGQSIAEGLAQGQQAYKGAMKSSLDDQLTMYKLAEAKKAKERENAVAGIMAKAYTPAQAAVAPSTPMFDLLGQEIAGPNMPKAATQAGYNLQAVAPQLIQTEEGRKALTEMVAANKALMPEYKVVGDYLYQITPDGATQIAGQPKMPSSMQEFLAAQQNPAYAAYLKESKKPLVVMNEGQKGFENVSSLNKMFTSEPIYKELAGMDTAYKQVTSAIAAGTPIGDTAAATKIMKLLDPGSVVRETELGMAMAATGKLDLLSNYLNNYIKGTKLTDNQRKEFQSLANELYNAAASAYNTKRSQYKAIGDKFGLDTDVALGAPAKIMSSMPDGVVVKRRTQ